MVNKTAAYKLLLHYKYPLFLILFIAVSYLPLASFQFALKNDAFIYNFPNKYFFSESLRAGFVPWWNPYLNFGFPLYADPGFAWWNPITWLFGLIGYNPYSFTVELLLYLFIAATGMYWLAIRFRINKGLAFVMACMFACSGFFVGNMQHINFLTCAAFIPWVTGAWFKLQKSSSFKNAFNASIASYLLCTAGHPAIPIGMIYFMIFLSLLYFYFFRNELRVKYFLKWNIAYVFFTLLLLLPVILSWAQLMPLYVRSGTVDHLNTNQLGFTVPSYISFISPAATIKDASFYNTDVSMRNGYFSLFGFVAFFTSLIYIKNRLQKIFLIAGGAMLLLSLGGMVKQIVYENLPLLKFIRTNGEYRVFALLCFIIIVGIFLQKLHLEQKTFNKLKFPFQLASSTTGLITMTLVLIFAFNSDPIHLEVLLSGGIKTKLEKITFPIALLSGFSLSLFFCILYFLILKKGQGNLLYIFVLVDLTLNTWISLPVTGVGQKSVGYIDSLLDKAPKGFPRPSLTVQTPLAFLKSEDELRIGSWSWYDKRIVHKRIEYPSALVATEKFYAQADSTYLNKPFAYLKHGNGHVFVKSFNPNGFSFIIALTSNDTLVVLQNNYPGWEYFLSGAKSSRPIASSSTFIHIPLSTNERTVLFRFLPLLSNRK